MPTTPSRQPRLALVRNSHKLAIIIGLAAALVVQWVATGYWIGLEYRNTRGQAESLLQQLTVSMREQTTRQFRDIEGSLQMVDFWMRTHQNIDPRTDPQMAQLLKLIRDGSSGLIDIRLVAEDGEIFYGPGRNSKRVLNAADRDYFRAQFNPQTRGLFIDKPMRNRVNQEWAIPISYPLSQSVGGISVVFASVSPELLIRTYEQIRFKPGGVISLMRNDGMLLARAPGDQRDLGISIEDTPDYQEQFSKRPDGVYLFRPSATDNLARLVSFSRIEQYPLTVVVSASTDDIFAAWSESRQLILWSGVLLSGALVASALGMLYVLAVMQKSERLLQRQAFFDALTNCLNRHAFDDASNREFARAARHARPLTVLTLDLDLFKQVNDTHGHATGDAVLRQITQVWMKNIRTTDIIGRLGGEEFAVLMPDTGLDSGLQVAEYLLRATRSANVQAASVFLNVTVSIGVATLTPRDSDFDDLFARADGALYCAKRSGRDRIEVR